MKLFVVHVCIRPTVFSWWDKLLTVAITLTISDLPILLHGSKSSFHFDTYQKSVAFGCFLCTVGILRWVNAGANCKVNSLIKLQPLSVRCCVDRRCIGGPHVPGQRPCGGGHGHLDSPAMEGPAGPSDGRWGLAKTPLSILPIACQLRLCFCIFSMQMRVVLSKLLTHKRVCYLWFFPRLRRTRVFVQDKVFSVNVQVALTEK